ncbi:MAG: type II toxin-antitoxin system VapB family antitoxin [Acidimicrobiales bacterium]
MIRRTTIEIDDTLLQRAMRALGTRTKRATVEEALRRASEASKAEDADRRRRGISVLQELGELERTQGIRRNEMWR